MKIILPIKVLRAHKVICGVRETNLALNGIFITPKHIISSDSRIVMLSDNKLNGQMRADYLVKIDRIPASGKATMAVIDTDTNLVYYIDHIVTQQTLKDHDFTNDFVEVAAARLMRYPYPDVLPAIAMKPGALGNIRLSAHVMRKLTDVAKAINSKSGEIDISFQSDRTATVNAIITSGATSMSLFFKPMR